jgi:3-methyladenine DNA glycosylase AlkD
MHKYLIPLAESFEKHRNPEDATAQKCYMKGQYEFYGIRNPVRKEILKQHIAEYGLPGPEILEDVIRSCWELPERDFQSVGILLLVKLSKKLEKDIIPLLEHLITNKSWWDTVDGLAAWIVADLLKKYPELIVTVTTKWMDSENVWLQRTCILFQLHYKKDIDLKLLYGFIDRLSGSKVFWIQKAIGWILREYSKTDPDEVIRFVNSHHLAPLSKREALKVIKRHGQG